MINLLNYLSRCHPRVKILFKGETIPPGLNLRVWLDTARDLFAGKNATLQVSNYIIVSCK